MELDTAVGRAAGEQVDGAHRHSVVVSGHKGEPHPVGEQGRGHVHQVAALHGGGDPVMTHLAKGLGQRRREGSCGHHMGRGARATRTAARRTRR